MQTNSRMRAILLGVRAIACREKLPDDALAVLEAGWTVGPHGFLLLTALWGDGSHRKVDRAAAGSYEYHVNDVYIPLDDLAADMDSYLHRAAWRGITFAAEMLNKARVLPDSDTLRAVVNISIEVDSEEFPLQGATVRFFSRRGDYPDWFEDLERFESHAVAVLDLSDVAPT